ncbi:hypothetical protein GGI11_005223 [Coemansia sp. RSA 2049]|nr:hypothetical protein GGI11_005223 [Coemansia sp. RSA 2049]KAJ2518968.1 hypothetical protein H4217_002980 [Coemansia sp. RSA 1939]KAJ2613588.1 hypothetical protein EV177_002465 [Coemansia sp. RSA 1804]KAJ2687598.1 hypothetical protein GGH99_003228 [Coemansia sp. RSA 1285]
MPRGGWSRQQYILFSALTFLLLTAILYIPQHSRNSNKHKHKDPAMSGGPRKVGYFTGWSIYARKFEPSQVAVEKLTHVNYGFAKLDENDQIALVDPWADIQKEFAGTEYAADDMRGNIGEFNNENGTARSRNPRLRTLVSVGGWTLSGGFSPMAGDARRRRRFVQSVGEFLAKYRFDGIDIDWEHPVEGGMDGTAHSPHDGHNYLVLLRELRAHLDSSAVPRPRFGRFEISIATSAAPAVYRHLDLGSIAHVVDHINIMAYDYAGPWSPVTGHQQNLFHPSAGDSGLASNDTVSDFLQRGVPPEKIVLGVGFFGRGFANVSAERAGAAPPGLGCPFSGSPPGTWEQGVFDYKALRAAHLREGSGYAVHWDDAAKAPVLYSASDRVMISFDNPVAVSWKADYVLRRRLGGIMIWELSQDYGTELLDKICEYLG